MQFSFKFVAAAAFLLPSLISGAALAADSLAARDTSDTTLTERSPEFNALELTRREAVASLEAAQVKRDAYDQAYEEYATGSIEARTPADEAEADRVYRAYKAAQAAQGGMRREYNNQARTNTWENKLRIATNALHYATQEYNGRATFQQWLTSGRLDMTKRGRTAADVRDHAAQLRDMQACVTTWQRRQADAQRRVTNNTPNC